MRLLSLCVAFSGVVSFAPVPSTTVSTRRRVLRPVLSVNAPAERELQGSYQATVDALRRATEACDNNECSLDELAALKTTLLEHATFLEQQISFYDEDCDVDAVLVDDDADCSGDSAELRALTKFIVELRDLHSAVDNQLRVIDDRLSYP